MLKKTSFMLFPMFLFSCSTDVVQEENVIIEELDTTSSLLVEVDTVLIPVNNIDTVALDSSYTIDVEEVKFDNALDAIVEGKDVKGIDEGYSFCDCVKLMDKLETKMFEDDDADIDALMAEQKSLLEGDCTILKAGQGITTAEDKEAYEKKKQDCLN